MGAHERRSIRRHLLVAIVVVTVAAAPILGSVALTGVASAATITVDDSGGADYTRIQWAIDNATAGDVIEVADGSYSPPFGGANTITVDKAVTLRGDVGGTNAGAGASAPTVAAQDHVFLLTPDASGATIEGFVLDSSYVGGIGFDLPAGETLSDVTIRDNTFQSIDGSTDRGVDATAIDGNLSDVSVENNRFTGSGGDAGIAIWDDEDSSDDSTGTTYDSLTIANNTFVDVEHAVEFEFSTPNGSITDLRLVGNDLTATSPVTDYGFDLYLNGYADGATLSGVTVADNRVDVEQYPLYLNTLSDATTVEDVLVENNTLSSAETRTRISVAQQGSSLSRLQVCDNTIVSESTTNDPAISVSTSSGADMSDVAICDNTVTAVDDGITVNWGNGNGTNVRVANNVIDSEEGAGTQITTGDRTANLTVGGNTIGSSATVGGEGIDLDFQPDDATTQDVEVVSNVVRGDNQVPISVTFAQGGATLDDLRIAHNDVHVANGSDAPGINVDIEGDLYGPAMTASNVSVFHNNVTGRDAALDLSTISLVTTDPINVSYNRLNADSVDGNGIVLTDDGTGIDAAVDVENNDISDLDGHGVHVDTFDSLDTAVSVVDNELRSNGAGIYVTTTAGGVDVSASGNNFAGNGMAINNTGSGYVAATVNWWGAADGPSGGYTDPNNVTIVADGSGDPVSNTTGTTTANVDFYPYTGASYALDTYDPSAPVPTVNCPSVTTGADADGSPSTPTPTPSPTTTPTPTATPSGGGGGGSGSGDGPGTPAISVRSASLSATSIAPGDAVTVAVTLENTGDGGGTYEATLRVDGTAVDSGSAYVGAGGTRTLHFTHTFQQSGTYDLVVDGNAVGSVVVAVPTTSPEPATATSPGGPSTAAGTEAVGTEAGGALTPTPAPTTEETGPGFGVLLALVVLGGVALLGARRR